MSSVHAAFAIGLNIIQKFLSVIQRTLACIKFLSSARGAWRQDRLCSSPGWALQGWKYFRGVEGFHGQGKASLSKSRRKPFDGGLPRKWKSWEDSNMLGTFLKMIVIVMTKIHSRPYIQRFMIHAIHNPQSAIHNPRPSHLLKLTVLEGTRLLVIRLFEGV